MWWIGGAALLLLFLIYLGLTSVSDKLHLLSNELKAIQDEIKETNRLLLPISDEAESRQEELDAIDRK